jgi:hypothetical protein
MEPPMPPYEPDGLPLQDLDLGRLITLGGEANAALARYGGLLQGLGGPGQAFIF